MRRFFLVLVCGMMAFSVQCGGDYGAETQCGEVDLPTVSFDHIGWLVKHVLYAYGNPTGEDQFTLTWTSPPDPRGGYLQHRIPLMKSDDTVQVRVIYWRYPDGRFKYRWSLQAQKGWQVFHGIDYRGIAGD